MRWPTSIAPARCGRILLAPYNNRGLIFMRQGELQRAFDEFNRAFDSNSRPTSRYIHLFNRGRVQTYRKQYDAALADFAEAKQLNPTARRSRLTAASPIPRSGNSTKRWRIATRCWQSMPKSIYALASRGNVYLAKGDLDAALKDYNDALKINPNNFRAHADRGQLFEKRRDLAAARADYRSASAALTKFDEIDTAIARRFAKERLAALTGLRRADSRSQPPESRGTGARQARARSR